MRIWLARTVGTVVIAALGLAVQGFSGDRDDVTEVFAGLAIVPLLVAVFLHQWPLRADDADAVRSQYYKRFFIAVGIAQTSVAFGFAGMFLTGRLWMLGLGTVASLVALGLHAPTRRAIELEDRRLREQESPATLSDALDDSTLS